MIENHMVNEDTRSKIVALVAAETAAWNRGSAAQFADRALPDISFTNIFGMFSVGKAPFVAQHERIFSTIYKGSTNHLQIEHIKTADSDAVDQKAASTNRRRTRTLRKGGAVQDHRLEPIKIA